MMVSDGAKLPFSWWKRLLTRYRCTSTSLFYGILVVVVCLGLTVALVSASCQHVEIFEAVSSNKFNCSREILLSSLTTISFLVVLALETSVQSGVSEQWRFHVNILELVWSSLMLLSWLVSSAVNSLEWHRLVLPDDEPHQSEQQQLIGAHYSVVRESYIVLIVTSYANSVTWATLVYIHLRRSLQVRGSFKMYWKWLLLVMMCLMFGVNAYLILHVGLQRSVCARLPPHHEFGHVKMVVGLDAAPNMSILFPLVAMAGTYNLNCSWPVTKQNLRREEFCREYYWYRDICRCKNPIDFDLRPSKLYPNHISDVPLAVIASNRTRCLSRALYHLLLADGANSSMIRVFLDGDFQEQIDVCKLFGVSVTIHDIHYSRNSKNSFRITEHYRLSLTEMFDYYPDASSIIVLEDDLQVSPDFFSYFSQTIHLLDKDDSLYCISSWNDFGYQHASRDPSLLYRVDTMPGLGWLLKRSLFKGELEEKWPNETEPLTWDGWLREPAQRKGRECVIPDVSRTFHFAAGTHIYPEQQRRYFETRSFNQLRHVHLKNISRLTKHIYEKTVHHLIRSATPVNHSITKCTEELIPNTTDEHYVIYLDQTEHVVVQLMECFQLWDIDIRGDHKNMWRFWYRQNHIIVLRCPISPYCVHMPSNISPLKLAIPATEIIFWNSKYRHFTRSVRRKRKQKRRAFIIISFYLLTSIVILAICIRSLSRYVAKVKQNTISAGCVV